MIYTLRATFTETQRYHIEADSPEEAREILLSGEADDPFETINSTVDDVVIEKEEL